MPEAVLRSETFSEGYRITSTGTELRIEATEYQPRPLRLNREEMARFGLQFEHDHYIEIVTSEEPTGVVDKMLATLDQAANLMISQLPKSKWKWDVENLKRIYTILGGLDEKVVQEILDEEKG